MQYGGFAQVYDRLMLSDFDYEDWAQYIHGILTHHANGVQTVLDCACGTGLLTIRLAKMGYRLTGLDISEEMLEQAAQNSRDAGVIIPFVRMDMCQIAVHRPVDAILSTCDGVNYLLSTKKLRGFFSSAYKSIVPGGILCFDVSTRYKLEHILGNNTFTEDNSDAAYIWKNTYDQNQKLSEMELTLFIRQGEYYKRVYEQHIQRGHSKEEIENALKSTGFTQIYAYEAFSMDEPRKESERIQFVAVR